METKIRLVEDTTKVDVSKKKENFEKDLTFQQKLNKL